MNNEKKKMIVLGVLVTLMLAIGAFQFVGKKPAPDLSKFPAAEPTPQAAGTSEPAATQEVATKSAGPKNPELANDLPERDPFAVPAFAQPKPAGTFTPPVATTMPTKPSRSFGQLPNPGSIGPLRSSLGGPLGSQPVTVTPELPPYRVVGVIQGVKPLAMFEDGAGNQKLVPLGGALDGDTKLTDIAPNAVSLVFRGQRHRLSIGGNPVGK